MPNNEILINQILETDNITGTMYYQFLENAIKMNNRIRFSLIDFPAIFLQINPYKEDKLQYPALYNLLSPTLYKINKLIIDNNDFELFKSEIDHFATFQVLKAPIRIIQNIESDFSMLTRTFHINHSIVRPSEEIKIKIDYSKFLIKYKLLSDLKTYETANNEIESFKSEILSSIDEFKDKEKLKSILPPNIKIDHNVYEDNLKHIELVKKDIIPLIDGTKELSDFGIKPKLYEFRSNALIYRTFFIIGAYLIFSKRNKDKNKVNYIHELWNHTHPIGQNVEYISANIPVTFNAFWLIYLYLFGLKGDETWMDWPWHEFDDFHSSKQYIVQYFLLCLTKSGDIDIFPNLDHLKRLNSNNETNELKEWYDLAYRFSFKHSELIENIDILIDESEDWDRLLSYTKRENDVEKEINAKAVLIETKSKIEQVMNKINGIIPDIERLFPLDPEKIEEAREEISTFYFKKSKIPDIFNLRPYNSNIDSKREFTQVALRPLVDKHCVIKTDFVYCGAIWHKIGHEVALGEYNHLFNVINESNNIERFRSTNTDINEIYKEITSTVNLLKEKNNPNLLLLPNEIYSELEEQSLFSGPVYEKVVYEEYTYLLIDELKLRMIGSHTFKNIVILNNESISWIYKPDLKTNKRIIVEVLDHEEDSSKADVTAKTVVYVEIKDTDTIKIIETDVPKDD
jgi:hypothetical protein